MKSATAKEYAESYKALKAAAARLETAKQKVVFDLQTQIKEIVNTLKPKYPELEYAVIQVSTSPNNASKRPKPEQGGTFVHFSINPYFYNRGLEYSVVQHVVRSFHPSEAEVKNQIILQLELKGEWKFVDGSMFFYNDGPDRTYWSDWAMVPVS